MRLLSISQRRRRIDRVAALNQRLLAANPGPVGVAIMAFERPATKFTRKEVRGLQSDYISYINRLRDRMRRNGARKPSTFRQANSFFECFSEALWSDSAYSSRVSNLMLDMQSGGCKRMLCTHATTIALDVAATFDFSLLSECRGNVVSLPRHVLPKITVAPGIAIYPEVTHLAGNFFSHASPDSVRDLHGRISAVDPHLPVNSATLFYRGREYALQKKFSRSVEDSLDALALRPLTVEARCQCLNYLPNLLLERKNYAEAAELFLHALKKNRKDARAAGNLSFIYCEMRRYKDAIKVCLDALGNGVRDAVVYYNLADSLRACRRKEEAAAYYGKALALDANLIENDDLQFYFAFSKNAHMLADNACCNARVNMERMAAMANMADASTRSAPAILPIPSPVK